MHLFQEGAADAFEEGLWQCAESKCSRHMYVPHRQCSQGAEEAGGDYGRSGSDEVAKSFAPGHVLQLVDGWLQWPEGGPFPV